ncbi:hypothetical protein LWI29_009225 [Acer saccharum]|uniref:Uncharacterized protein n=1 Tax=Acer saccharum TaxID=4024 RepID=A0AA39VX82_ACESA|nr:hypothetical protein LWI29_009225 [Acer saccharum]
MFIVTQKNNLKNMVASSEWTDSDWASTTQGKWVADLLRDITFWEKTRILLAATAPLVRILVPIDGVSKLQIGLIYYSIIQAKEEIKKQLGNEAFHYMPIWNVIECVWDQYLYRPLYGVGYYLNPALLYTEKMYLNGEVEHGLKSCIFGMFEGRHVQDLISQQLQKYEQGEGAFKDGSTLQGLKDASPTEWWSRYDAMERNALSCRSLPFAY